MKSATGTTTAPVVEAAEMWNASLDQYRHAAADVLASHSRAGHTCQTCHQEWPCKAACAAEFVLEL